MDDNDSDRDDDRRERRPWFGPKRVGFGVSPQTWQGWLVMLVVVVVIVVVVTLLRR